MIKQSLACISAVLSMTVVAHAQQSCNLFKQQPELFSKRDEISFAERYPPGSFVPNEAKDKQTFREVSEQNNQFFRQSIQQKQCLIGSQIRQAKGVWNDPLLVKGDYFNSWRAWNKSMVVKKDPSCDPSTGVYSDRCASDKTGAAYIGYFLAQCLGDVCRAGGQNDGSPKGEEQELPGRRADTSSSQINSSKGASPSPKSSYGLFGFAWRTPTPFPKKAIVAVVLDANSVEEANAVFNRICQDDSSYTCKTAFGLSWTVPRCFAVYSLVDNQSAKTAPIWYSQAPTASEAITTAFNECRLRPRVPGDASLCALLIEGCSDSNRLQPSKYADQVKIDRAPLCGGGKVNRCE